MPDIEDHYVAMAARQLVDEDATAHAERIQSRAALLKETAEAKQRHQALCSEAGLPDTASPRQATDALARRRDTFFSGFLSVGGPIADAKFRALAIELKLDPGDLGPQPRETVWQAMRAQNHPLLQSLRDKRTGGLVMPPEPLDAQTEHAKAVGILA
jgi:hypothetical protein